MRLEDVEEAAAEARRFLDRVDALTANVTPADARYHLSGSPETGAVKRASMDLTRALARMRNQ